MRLTPPALAAACAASLLLLVAGCDKDDEADPPAELVDLVPGIAVSKLWDANVGGDAEKLRLALGLALDGGTLYAASREGEIEALPMWVGQSVGLVSKL